MYIYIYIYIYITKQSNIFHIDFRYMKFIYLHCECKRYSQLRTLQWYYGIAEVMGSNPVRA